MNRISKFVLAIAGLMLLSGGGQSWATEPPCTTSDSNGNTACGTDALEDNTGDVNTAIGYNALFSNTTGDFNTASGTAALLFNTTGNDNTASGWGALENNTTGSYNAATGASALQYNTTGNDNTANGIDALNTNTTGSINTASGAYALLDNTTGYANTASGYNALLDNTTGNNNTASGIDALQDNTTGDHNTGVGVSAGVKNTTGSNNTFIGYNANANATNYTNGTALGNGATLFASNSIVLGNKSITKIYAKVTSITALSDRREKKDIAALSPELGLGFIEKLQPVSYRFKDGDETQRYGFIAQDLEQALPERLRDTVETSQPEHGLALIERQNDAARTYRVAYGELTAPMVKAIQEQQAEIAALRQTVEALKKQVGAMKLAQNPALAQ
jgi:trimeric autotransporter adhesin